MAQHRKPIRAKLVEFVCDCGLGVYRLVQNPPVSSDFNHIWRHRCSHCHREVELAAPYPLIEITLRNSHRGDKIFVLKDALPAPYSPGARLEFDLEIVDSGTI